MSIITYKLRGHFNHANHREYLVDSDADLAELPGLDVCAVGSKACSAESGAKKILNSAGEWVDDLTSETTGGGSGVTEQRVNELISAALDDLAVVNCGTSEETIDDLYDSADGRNY